MAVSACRWIGAWLHGLFHLRSVSYASLRAVARRVELIKGGHMYDDRQNTTYGASLGWVPGSWHPYDHEQSPSRNTTIAPGAVDEPDLKVLAALEEQVVATMTPRQRAEHIIKS